MAELRLDTAQFPRGYSFNSDEINFPVNNLRFLGLISMSVLPRVAIMDAVTKYHSSGIKVIMVTDEHPITTRAIAREVGIIGEKSETVEDIAVRLNVPDSQVDPRDARACVVHSNDFKNMTPSEIDVLFETYQEIVIARTTFKDQLEIVKYCQAEDIIVAVFRSDDKIPFLKKVNVGGVSAPNWILIDKNDSVTVHMPDEFQNLDI
jgi:sodium/potassium-transporting ATPase subunit alpha